MFKKLIVLKMRAKHYLSIAKGIISSNKKPLINSIFTLSAKPKTASFWHWQAKEMETINKVEL